MLVWFRKSAIILTLVMTSSLWSGHGVLADDIAPKVDAEESENLIYEGLGNKPDGSLDYGGESPPPAFYDFQGLGPVAGSYGFFAVNPWTGDVWALWGCKRLATPTLRKSQAKIRQRFTKDELKQYPKLHKIRPECITD